MNDELDAYSLNIRFAENVIGELSLNKETGLPKLEYNDYWQQNGFAISPNLTLDNNHGNSVAYNFLAQYVGFAILSPACKVIYVCYWL